MTTPQEMGETNPPAGDNEPQGAFWWLISRLIGWTLFIGFIGLVTGTIAFIGLALWRGIIWLWPGGAAA
jgi:hypothetical protein